LINAKVFSKSASCCSAAVSARPKRWRPEAALRDAERGLQRAREIGEIATLMYALSVASMTRNFCGDYAITKVQTDELAALADEKESLFWQALCAMDRGFSFFLAGRPTEALQVIASAISRFRSTGATMYLPWYLSILARVHAELGQIDNARSCVDEAMTLIETAKERVWEAEVHRVAGEIALKELRPDMTNAQLYFERALATARRQQAKSWELRASMSLARLWRDQGKPQQARELLAPVYGWFTEGFDTRDLKEAKALLESLVA
jgi:predicted ATPase